MKVPYRGFWAFLFLIAGMISLNGFAEFESYTNYSLLKERLAPSKFDLHTQSPYPYELLTSGRGIKNDETGNMRYVGKFVKDEMMIGGGPDYAWHTYFYAKEEVDCFNRQLAALEEAQKTDEFKSMAKSLGIERIQIDYEFSTESVLLSKNAKADPLRYKSRLFNVEESANDAKRQLTVPLDFYVIGQGVGSGLTFKHAGCVRSAKTRILQEMARLVAEDQKQQGIATESEKKQRAAEESAHEEQRELLKETQKILKGHSGR
jgi:hypothetical protein